MEPQTAHGVVITGVHPADPLDNDSLSPPTLPCSVEEMSTYGYPNNNELCLFWDRFDCGPSTMRSILWLCPLVNASAPPPYAKFLPALSYGPLLRGPRHGLAFAQDHAKRNLILKIIEKGSSEYQINSQILRQQSNMNEKGDFQCVLAPVAILDTPTDCSFLVMPMWGSPICLERMQRVRDIVQFIRCTLRGLSYLHGLRIVHRDICEQNIVVNCHSPGASLDEFPDVLSRHWGTDNVTYALIDFGQSLQLPLDTSIVNCRRPGEETAIGMSINKPVDGNLGEAFYNPFSYDVAALGFLYRYYFAEAVPVLPGLAALFDRMTDYCPSRRMTAQEALRWFEDMVAQQPPACLDAVVTLKCDFQAMSDDDFYWSKLSMEDQDVHYSLIDFDISLCLPMETSLTAYRRSSWEAYQGTPIYHTQDVDFGEHDYNPFAYDVGSLGNFYRIWFWKTVPFVPQLAPLFDKMTTHIAAERLTAPEAAEFVEALFAQLSDSVLDTPPYLTCGRDAKERDIVVKLIDKGSMEDKILRTLTEYPELYDSSAFTNVLPPTTIIESPYEFTMVATPMWGSECNLLEIETVRDVLTFMRCTLTGLTFLHDKRIVHRDIHETNIATSWYCYSADSNHFSQSLRERRRADSVTYALYDFDCALQLPPGTSLKDCRRPPMETTIGKPDYHPPDTWQGEVDYNPFAFDVACLGNLFNVVTNVPFLALLYAKMATFSAHERFTAAEALQFLREIEKGLTSDTLDSSVILKCQRVHDLSDQPELYWSRLSPELQRQWTSYRPTTPLWVDRLLRRISETASGWKFVMFLSASIGSAVFQPPDVRSGEHEYNPYAFDVASLGNIFRIHFNAAVAAVPLLAPLFDKLTTHVIPERFTASESARFIDGIIAQLPAASLVSHALDPIQDADNAMECLGTEQACDAT
ncbi:hypothetical protein ACG7TL_005135 [Trametes sanguinea]